MGGGERTVTPMDVQNYDWGQRMFRPNQPEIQNTNGSTSTHRMAAETDTRGNWWVFPTIVETSSGKLKQFDDHQEAMQWNMNRGQAVPFGKDKDSALSFASGAYKQGSPLFDVMDALTRVMP